jgi:hypothetical protein
MTVGSGASLTTSGTGSIAATQMATSAITYVQTSIATTGTTGTATCPSGSKVIGGGVTGGNKALDESGPVTSNTAWKATFTAGITAVATVTAICMKTP